MAAGLTSSTTVPSVAPHLCDMAQEIARDIEGIRRQVTLSGGLLLIPATMVAIVAVAAAFGVSGAWLAICASVGLSVGPAVCLSAMFFSHVLGQPVAYRLYARRCARLGLAGPELKTAWRVALEHLDDEERRGLCKGVSPPALRG